jgi:hypothetical protein
VAETPELKVRYFSALIAGKTCTVRTDSIDISSQKITFDYGHRL